MAEVLPQINVTDSPSKDGGWHESSPVPSPTKDASFGIGDGGSQTGSSSEGMSLRHSSSNNGVTVQPTRVRGLGMDDVNKGAQFDHHRTEGLSPISIFVIFPAVIPSHQSTNHRAQGTAGRIHKPQSTLSPTYGHHPCHPLGAQADRGSNQLAYPKAHTYRKYDTTETTRRSICRD